MPKMIVSRGNMKRKRKVERSLILEDSPKRTKVHAQRKFAQGSNVNSPVITPVEELEKPEGSGMRLVPDPVELLPTKRPNTEDFLTFLCFRGTPILPPTLNFFNTASIVDTNGQVHEIKSESLKNGPIDTSIIAKTGCGPADRPFIAFGVRKRADPVVISRQMDKKRRHALALQALRRKYQEQKMAKIRAVTISKLSEKVTNRTLVRTNSVSKTGTVTKKSTVQKTKVIATKRVKVITRTVKTTLRPKMQAKMCLRSFRGRFVQKELPFRNRNVGKKTPSTPVRKIIKKVEEKKVVIKKNRRSLSSEFSSEDNEPLVTTSTKDIKRSPKVLIPKIDSLPHVSTSSNKKAVISKRVTRSEQVKSNVDQKRQQKKKRILIPTTTVPLVKVRNLRSQTVLKPGTKTKPKRMVLVNETLTAVKSPKTRKLVVKTLPQMKKPLSVSDRVLRTPQGVEKQIQKTTRKVTRTQEKITNVKKPNMIKKVLRKPIKKEKLVELPSKKSDKNSTKRNEDVKVESDVQGEKPIRKEKLVEPPSRKTDKNSTRKNEDVKVESHDQGEKPIRKEKLVEPPSRKTDKNSTRKNEDVKVESHDQVEKPIKKEKLVEIPSKKTEKNSTKKNEDVKVESHDQVEKPVKKEKLVEPLSRKTDKNSNKKNEDVKVESQDQVEKSSQKPQKRVEKITDQDKKCSDKVAPKIIKEVHNKEKKTEIDKTVSSRAKLETKNSKTSGKNYETAGETSTKTVEGCSSANGDTEGNDIMSTKKENMKIKAPSEKKIAGIKHSALPASKGTNTKVAKKPVKSQGDTETALPESKLKATPEEKIELPSKKENKQNEDVNMKGIKKMKLSKTTVPNENQLDRNKNEDFKLPINESIGKVGEKPEVKNTTVVKKGDQTEIKDVKINEKVAMKIEKKEKPNVVEKLDQLKAIDKTRKVDKKTVSKPVEKEEVQAKEVIKESREICHKAEETEQKVGSSRPSRKTKEAAAIYMEILSHKLVNDSKIDDDNISIDSFPELPNVKRTEQRENEFRAKSTQKGAEESVPKVTKVSKDMKLKANNVDETVKNDDSIMRPRKGGSKRFPTTLNRIGNKNTSKDDNVDTPNKQTEEEEVSCEKPNIEKPKESKQTATMTTPPDDCKMTSKKGAVQVNKRKKKAAEKLVEIDEEKIKEEIMREIQEKLGTNIPLYKESKKKDCTVTENSCSKPSKPVSKRKSLLSDGEESESIENIRKKLKSTDGKIPDIVAKNTNSNDKDSVNKEDLKLNDSVSKAESKESTGTTKKKLKLVEKINIRVTPENKVTPEQVDNKNSAHLVPLPCITKSEEKIKDINPSDETKEFSQEKVVETVSNKDTDVSKIDNELNNKGPVLSSCAKNVEATVDAKPEKVLKVEKNDLTESGKKTRNLNQIKGKNNEDSDESFHVDVKIPRKKQITRHKVPKLYRSFSESEDSLIWEEEKEPKKPPKKSFLDKSISSGESDHSTTSQPDKKQDNTSGKAKKYTKTKSKVKVKVDHFSDSDEEPLSKLTHIKAAPINKLDKTEKEIECQNEKQEAPDETAKKSAKPIKDSKAKPKAQKQQPTETGDNQEKTPKPKRECAKRPQNYLPMFSSSDDEDHLFYGFDVEANREKEKAIKPAAIVPTQATTDLCSKDIGRRFGKGKVNMSNEQIEQWLKDSVLAGNIKKEDDDMLKFGEKIPTETSLELPQPIDTQQLKTSLLISTEDKKEEKPKQSAPKLLSPSSEKIKLSFSSKNQSLDKKLIFRKEKICTTPNANAFSANNESSVYAFGEENEDVISTPFRRPVRRPSSTATSKSEEEGKGEETTKIGQFRRPPVKQDPKSGTKDTITDDVFNLPDSVATAEDSTNTASSAEFLSHKFGESKETVKSDERPTSMIPPTYTLQKSKCGDYRNLKFASRSFDRTSETSEDGKYKVPSSPSASSSSSAKLYKRQPTKPKVRIAAEVCNPVSVPSFPNNCFTPMLVEAPTFYPVDKEFQDPLEYIEKIRHKAEEFGICRIVPPSSFKPECKVTDDMRFTAYNQYVHKMLHRWGPNFKEFMAIKKYLHTQNIMLVHSPWIGGMEIDLPRLYQTVQSLGGLKEVIEKKKWPRVSEMMKIPKSAQDRVTKLDDIYCKYLLPYDTLSPAEREKLFDEVETEWAKRESTTLLKLQQNLALQSSTNDSEVDSDSEVEECIVKGKNVALNAFYRIARNTMSVWFKSSEPSSQEVEQEFWRHVTQKQNHICVHSGSIDSGSWGYGFAVSKNSPFARNAWNLKVLTNNSGSVLRSLGPIMGVTVPTLHVGMVFSACCWYRDPHSLPWIEYLHTGGSKIWYGIPDSASGVFHSALTKLVPNYCKNKTFWLASDTVMVPPSLLIENGVSLCRTVQEPGQFVVVFPKAFTSSICTGYVVSESVYFAPPYWLKTAQKVFNDMRASCESSMFSLDRLLLSIANDTRSSVDVLRLVLTLVKDMCDEENRHRNKLKELGLTVVEKLPPPEVHNARKRKKLHGEEGDYECEICRLNLFVSMVVDTQENGLYCIEHAIDLVNKGKVQITNCKLLYTYDDEELKALPDKINAAIENKLQKKVPNKYYGMPTLLKS